jgi:hypothetical protein
MINLLIINKDINGVLAIGYARIVKSTTLQPVQNAFLV